MNANELMIGDWVYYIGDGAQKKKIVVEITQLHQVCLLDERLDTNSWILVKEKYIEPIPLTAEIMEKNGFEKDPESGEMIWCDDNVTEVVWCGTILNIRGKYANCEFATVMYVHQFQHALRLCGITKEIEL